jgi:hypothetical protein
MSLFATAQIEAATRPCRRQAFDRVMDLRDGMQQPYRRQTLKLER